MSDFRGSLTIFCLDPALMAAWVAFRSIRYSSTNLFCFFVTQAHLLFKNIIKYSPASTIHDSRLPPSIMKGDDRMQEITAGAVHAVRKLANKKNLVISTKFSLQIIFFWGRIVFVLHFEANRNTRTRTCGSA